MYLFTRFVLFAFLKDCGSPSKTGYAYTATSGTTYGETSSVACADGYEGTVSASSVTCEAAGTWTDVTGCTIKGTITLLTTWIANRIS